MAFTRPTLPDLIGRIAADFESRLEGADGRLRRSNINVFSRIIAAVAHALYGFVAWLAKQIMPDECDEDFLLRHANLWLRSGRIPAAYASGQATITGTNGTVIEAGTIFKRADGVAYATEAEVTIAGGTATLQLVAEETGQAGNADAGVTLTIDTPIAGAAAQATVTAGKLTGGADIESIEALRARVLDRIRQTPHGGAQHDYVTWAKEVPGVTRAWCYPLEMGDGTVTVRFVRDNDASLIPDAAEVTAVQAYIDGQRPVGGELFVAAPIAQPLEFQIAMPGASASVKAAVEASLKDLLLREAEPEGGDVDGTILLSHIREAISLAEGENDHVLVYPTADVIVTTGKMVTYGGVVWS